MRGEGKTDRVLVALIVISIILIAGLVFLIKRAELTETKTEATTLQLSTPARVHYAYSWDEQKDSIGEYSDTVAATYILLRANGLEEGKDMLSERLEDTDKAYKLAESINGFVSATDVAVPMTGQNLLFVPAPSLIWIRDGESNRPVVFLYADEATVTIADPYSGLQSYPFSVAHRMYDDAVRQAVYIADRGYTATSG